jgi:putative ABC transport system permease protein
VIDLWYAGVAGAQADRLAVRNKVSLIQPLPLSYLPRIASIPGVSIVTHAGWFGGTIGESREDFFATFYVDAATYFEVFDELLLSPEELAAFQADPCGAVVGETLARRYGWAPGDRIALRGTIFPGMWDFTVRGVYRGATPAADTTALVFGYRCLNERVPEAQRDFVGFYSVRVDDPSRSTAVAAAIDAAFADSPYETLTESERSFQLGFVAMSSAILSAVRIVSIVVLLILLLVVANTIAMGVRERTVELSTMRALGFRQRHIAALVLIDAATIGVISAAIGVAAAPLVVRAFGRIVAEQMGPLPGIPLRAATVATAVVASLLVAAAAGVLPALRATRIPVAEGLRREA